MAKNKRSRKRKLKKAGPLTRGGDSANAKQHQVEHANARNDELLVSNTQLLCEDELLEKVKSLWQFGDWEKLSELSYSFIESQRYRALIALYVAAAHIQLDNLDRGQRFIFYAQAWGFSKRRLAEILISGVHNTLGRAASLVNQADRAQKHYKCSLRIGTGGWTSDLIPQARAYEQSIQLGLFEGREHAWQSISFKELCFPKHKETLPVIHTIHQLSCTGGTLFTKCLAAMPNTFVLSEVDPFSTLGMDAKADFSPRDIITLLNQSNSSVDEKLIEDVFVSDIRIVAKSLQKQAKKLIIRDHSHSAYLTYRYSRSTRTLQNILAKNFHVESVLTVRNPIDSYLSLKANNWLHFDPSSFNEYCRRYLRFLEDHAATKIFRYEDFLSDPREIMRDICSELTLSFSENFLQNFPEYKFSGDSGRSGDVIAPRPRREYDREFEDEVNNARFFFELATKLGYPTTI